MNRLLGQRVAFSVLLANALAAAAQDDGSATALDDSDLPVTISVLQDVEITAVQENTGAPAGTEVSSRYSMVTLGLRKDAQFQMIDIHLEGGCQILFEGGQYSLASCPWLPGFRDHQQDIFRVMETSRSED